jgi:hypothetical protein
MRNVIYQLPILMQELMGRPLRIKISEKKVKKAESEEGEEQTAASDEGGEKKIAESDEGGEKQVDNAQPEES